MTLRMEHVDVFGGERYCSRECAGEDIDGIKSPSRPSDFMRRT